MITYLSVIAMHLKKHIKILISSRSSDNKSWSLDPCIPCPGRSPVWNVSFSTPDQTGTLHYRWSLHAQSADESKHSVSTPWRSQDTHCLTLNPSSPLSLTFKHHFTSLKRHLIFLQQRVLKWIFPWNCFTNTWLFSLIFHPDQIIFIHYMSRIATAIRGL